MVEHVLEGHQYKKEYQYTREHDGIAWENRWWLEVQEVD